MNAVRESEFSLLCLLYKIGIRITFMGGCVSDRAAGFKFVIAPSFVITVVQLQFTPLEDTLNPDEGEIFRICPDRP